ncbi:MAG: hypothetical protein KJ630_06020 [Proteobacteria bacterium]|nr:hypothetical protein [Pseudomonadota bacterium]
MYLLKIIFIDEDCRSKANDLESLTLPIFYMQDFSIQAITVHDISAACDLLGKAGYTVLDKNGRADIIFDDVKQLGSIVSTLRQHGFRTELADIADTIYQA